MNTQTLLNNVATTTNNDAIIVNAKEFLKALRFVAGPRIKSIQVKQRL